METILLRTLYDKLWDSHVVHADEDGTTVLYVDRHFLHEVSSAQPFRGLKQAGRKPWRESACIAMADHNVPTAHRQDGISDPISLVQVNTLTRNCQDNHILLFDLADPRQGIVHVVGPELGLSHPGMSLVCGDSHTTTHGALGALAFGIGVTEVETVLSTQCLIAQRSKTMLVQIDGEMGRGVTAKDLALAVVRKLGIGGGRGYAIEFAGEAVSSLSMEGRMTLCNMSIEAGARSGMVGVDQVTIDYLRGRPFTPKDADWHRAVELWKQFSTDEGAQFDAVVHLNISQLQPIVTWGTVPDMSVSIGERLPEPAGELDKQRRTLLERAYAYMDLTPGTSVTEIKIDKVFLGSCTNGRIEDLRAAAKVVKGRRVAANIKLALVVPGSTSVKQEAEKEGLDRIFREAGFEWRDSGCSMCLAMNADRLEAGERCASTSNRNFEGRQGQGGRTHLVSPTMAAAAAVAGHFVDVRDIEERV
jgi:3-isopropylmalate/(R)-2-methylmalate dehydratase large subunit